MSLEIAVNRRDVYSDNGNFEAAIYEIETSDGEFLQKMLLDHASDLVALRNALSHYIERNNLTPTISNPTHP